MENKKTEFDNKDLLNFVTCMEAVRSKGLASYEELNRLIPTYLRLKQIIKERKQEEDGKKI